MNKHLLPIAALALAGLCFVADAAAKGARKSDDPTVMTVAGKPVSLSEFYYLYNKNNTQQTSPQPVEDYVGLFVDYKLKVADAEAAGIDTTAAFLAEFSKYRDELAGPKLTDPAVEDSLVAEIHRHMATSRDVYYIMMPGGNSPAQRARVKQRADSVRQALADGADMAEMADKYSVDGFRNHGHMGWMKVNHYPYAFEKLVYDTPVGEVSQVGEFPFGYFVVRVAAERPMRQVKASHMLLRKFSGDPEGVRTRATLDSLRALATPGNFASLASRHSDDKQSAQQGGSLGWFSPGDMVQPFDSIAFAMPVGTISDTFETPFGYHIIYKEAERDQVPLAEVDPQIRANMQRDERADMSKRKRVSQLRTLCGAKTNNKALRRAARRIADAGAWTPALQSALEADGNTAATVGSRKVTVADVAKATTLGADSSAVAMQQAFDSTLDVLLDAATTDYYLSEDLPARDPDFRNLINEYRDGMLLFEVSNAKVWERSTKDKEGLEQYFRDHRDRYTWDKPRYKGFVIFASNDSVGAELRTMVDSIDTSLPPEESLKPVRERFGKDYKAQRVLAAQGENEIIDFLVFGGPAPTKPSRAWPFYFVWRGKVIDQPEEAADMRGTVTADYQSQLEREWLDYLRATYPVTIDYKALQQAKQQ